MADERDRKRAELEAKGWEVADSGFMDGKAITGDNLAEQLKSAAGLLIDRLQGEMDRQNAEREILPIQISGKVGECATGRFTITIVAEPPHTHITPVRKTPSPPFDITGGGFKGGH